MSADPFQLKLGHFGNWNNLAFFSSVTVPILGQGIKTASLPHVYYNLYADSVAAQADKVNIKLWYGCHFLELKFVIF